MEETQPFRFPDLPFDVRKQIYRFLLHSKDSICPDVTGSLKLYTYHSEKRKEWYENHSIIDVAILRANRQIHEEAAAVLYGDNAFTFDDWDYREKCVSRRHHACRCPGETDLNLLYTWLHAIGRRNRRALRRLRVILSHPAYMLCANERRFFPDARDQRYSPADDTMPQGHHLEAAFRLLALEHGLQRLKIEFDNKARWGKPELVRHFFANGLDSRVLCALASIKGLADLSFDPMPEAARDEAVTADLRRLTCRTRPVIDLGDGAPAAAPFVNPTTDATTYTPSPPEVLGNKLRALAERRQADVHAASDARAQKSRVALELAHFEEEIRRLQLEEMALEFRAAAADRRVEKINAAFGRLARVVPDPEKVLAALDAGEQGGRSRSMEERRSEEESLGKAAGRTEGGKLPGEADSAKSAERATGKAKIRPLRRSLSMHLRRVLGKGERSKEGSS